jgi:hypothetical protein
MEAVRTSETSVVNHFTRQYNPEDNSEHHTRRRENLKSHVYFSSNLQPSTSAFPRFNDGNVYGLNETNIPRQMTVTELLNRLTTYLYV